MWRPNAGERRDSSTRHQIERRFLRSNEKSAPRLSTGSERTGVAGKNVGDERGGRRSSVMVVRVATEHVKSSGWWRRVAGEVLSMTRSSDVSCACGGCDGAANGGGEYGHGGGYCYSATQSN